jgi:hypothetical protein
MALADARGSWDVRLPPEAPFTQGPYLYGQTIKDKGHAGIRPHGLCETVY